MTKRTRAEQARRAEWRARPPWPCVVLAVDPGSDQAGVALALPGPPGVCGLDVGLVWARTVDPMTDCLEASLDAAASYARHRGVRLVVVLEDWPAGGLVGAKTWLGLGAARGHWRRAVALGRQGRLADVMPSASGSTAFALLSRWRSMMDVPTRSPSGEKHTRDNGGWKRAAALRLAELAPRVRVDSDDAVEAALIALYGQRCDEVGAVLPATYLRRHGR